MPKQSSNHRATPITPELVDRIERLLADGEAVEAIAAQVRVPVGLVATIREDRARPPAPQTPKTIHRTRRPRRHNRPTKKHGPDTPGPQLEDGEELADVPIRCPGCGGLLAVVPCRVCRARKRRAMRRGG